MYNVPHLDLRPTSGCLLCHPLAAICMTMTAIPREIFLRAPLQRPSNVDSTKLDRISSEIALQRFNHEREVLTAQLHEWSVGV